MNPRVKSVVPNPDYTLTLTFANDEVRCFNVKPYLEIGIFQELKDLRVFNSVKPFLGSVHWSGGQDLCPDTLYLDSVAAGQAIRKRHSTPRPLLRHGAHTRQTRKPKATVKIKHDYTN